MKCCSLTQKEEGGSSGKKKSQHLSLDLDYMQNRSISTLLGEPNAYTPTVGYENV